MFGIVRSLGYVLLVLICACVYAHVRRLEPVMRLRARSKLAHFITPLPFTLACAHFAYNVFSTGWVCLMYVCVILLACDFTGFIVRLASGGRASRAYIAYKKWLSRGLAFLLALAVISYGLINMKTLRVTRYTLEAPALKGDIRLMLVSDAHLGTVYGAGELAAKLNSAAEAERPDIVILAGDIVDESTPASEAREFFSLIAPIAQSARVYAVYGNHDVMRYGGELSKPALERMITGAGIRVLEDEIDMIGEGAYIAGRADAGTRGRAGAEELISGYADDFVLLIDHQPRDTAAAARAGADVLLCGHTHDGQVFPLGILSGLAGAWDFTYGVTRVDDMTLIVTSGVAGWGCAVRTEGVSEYVIIDIKGGAI